MTAGRLSDDDIHIVPLNDLRGHESSTDCWCNPTPDDEPSIFIHHAMDGREEYEQGRKAH